MRMTWKVSKTQLRRVFRLGKKGLMKLQQRMILITQLFLTISLTYTNLSGQLCWPKHEKLK